MYVLSPRTGYFETSEHATPVYVSDAHIASAVLDPEPAYRVLVATEPSEQSGSVLDSLRTLLTAESYVVSDARRFEPPAAVPLPNTAPAFAKLFSELDELYGALVPGTAGIWFEAQKIVSSWLADFLTNLDRDSRRSAIDELATTVTIDWQLVNRPANAVAFLYNFLPYTDTGATVGSKRIRQFGDVFDVITVRQDDRKKIDPTIGRIAMPYIDDIKYLNLRPSWAGLNEVAGFATHATRTANQLLDSGKQYSYIYSRAMWIASHFAAAQFKSEHPELKWVAEFSDPVALDVEGNSRGGDTPTGPFYERLLAPIKEEYGDVSDHADTIYGLCELVAFAQADVLLFTNEYQRDAMLSRIKNLTLRERATSIAKVSNHPTLPSQFYGSDVIDYEVDRSKINLAYFGEFYSNRGLREVTDAIRELPEAARGKFHLHIFTNYAGVDGNKSRPSGMPRASYEELTERAVSGVGIEGIEDQVHFNASLPYLQFLGVTGKFDYLLVTDTRSGENHKVNPYLPSKWSDYSGSTAKTWALVEPGSILSGKPAEVVTPMGDSAAIHEAISKMLRDHKNDAQANVDAPASGGTPANGGDAGRVSPASSESGTQSPLRLGEPQADLEFSQEDLEISDSFGHAVQQQRLRWNRSANQIRANFHSVLAPRSRGTLFSTNPRRILEVVAQPESWTVAYEPSFALSRVSIEEPYIEGSSVSGPRSLSFNRTLEAGQHQTLAVAKISGLARDLSARAILGDHTLIAGSAAVIAARRLGLPFILNVTRPEILQRVLALPVTEIVTRPIPHTLAEIIRVADGVIVSDPEELTYFRARGVKVATSLTEEFLTDVERGYEERVRNADKRSGLTVAYAGTGATQKSFGQLGQLTTLTSVDKALGEFPDVVVLDLLGADSTRLDSESPAQSESPAEVEFDSETDNGEEGTGDRHQAIGERDQVIGDRPQVAGILEPDTAYLHDILGIDFTGHESLEDSLVELGRTGARVVVLLPENSSGSRRLEKLAHSAHIGVAATSDAFTGILPASGATTQSAIFANGMSGNMTDRPDVTSWDRFAGTLSTRSAALPPVDSTNPWSSDRATSMNLALARAEARGTIDSDAWWAGLSELSAGHTATDMVVHVVRSAGISIDHPRSPSGPSDARQEAYFRATGKLAADVDDVF